MCVLGLPNAFVPLWQVEQRPAAGGLTVAWLNVAVAHVVVELWQVSHWAVVAMCVAGLVWAFCAT
jgi:tryptophan-rich sensory protein